MENRADEINTCIACNQACLDHTFRGKRASCLVNPLVSMVMLPTRPQRPSAVRWGACALTTLGGDQAGYEYRYRDLLKPAARKKKVAVVGAGPAGLACATAAGAQPDTPQLAFLLQSRPG
jgi:2,4-dienoyl-CoA reductase (NADPH2)